MFILRNKKKKTAFAAVHSLHRLVRCSNLFRPACFGQCTIQVVTQSTNLVCFIGKPHDSIVLMKNTGGLPTDGGT